MTMHHLVGEDDFLKQCPYCRKELKPDHCHKWFSQFNGEIHYKVFDCSCGRALKVTVGFNGSGHDTWNKKKKNTIESRIREIEKIKVLKK